jgi:rhodanese-related sulfurtransferase
MVKEGAFLLDVRTPGEFDGGHIAEAVNIPLQAIQAGPVQGLPADRSAPIVTICLSGKRSMAALQLLKAQGYGKVSNSRGGMQAWMAERQPMKIR